MPYCLGNKAVGKAVYPDSDWVGSLDGLDYGPSLDVFIMTVLGGIPWQASITPKQLRNNTRGSPPCYKS